MLLVAMDVTIVSVALPGIRDSFQEPDALLAWVFTSYNITFAALSSGGQLGDRMGPPQRLPRRARLFAAASLSARWRRHLGPDHRGACCRRWAAR
jgi:MFS family permease